MKLTKDWIEDLPNELRSKALKNQEFNVAERSLSDTLLGAFNWYTSPEGHLYWVDVYQKIKLDEESVEKKNFTD